MFHYERLQAYLFIQLVHQAGAERRISLSPGSHSCVNSSLPGREWSLPEESNPALQGRMLWEYRIASQFPAFFQIPLFKIQLRTSGNPELHLMAW